MADLSRYTGAGASFNAVAIAGIPEGSIEATSALQKLIARYDGNLNPTFIGTLVNEPMINFQTRNINWNTGPVKVSVASPFVAYFRAYDDEGSLGSTWISVTVSNGLLVPQALEASAAKEATMTWQLHAFSSDGETSPLTIGSASLTQPLHGDAYTIGNLSLGSAIEQIVDLRLTFNYNVSKNSGRNGLPFPTFAAIDQAEITIEATSEDLSEASQVRLNTGQNVTSAIALNFPKLLEGAIPTVTGQLTATCQEAIVEVQSLQGGKPGTARITATLIETAGGYITFS